VHGVFVPNEPEIGAAIERIAKEQFGWVEARRELREALAIVPQFAERGRNRDRVQRRRQCRTKRTSTPAWRSA